MRDPGDKWLVTCFEVKVTELHGPFDGNMSHCFFNVQWTNSSSEEKKKKSQTFYVRDSEPGICPGRSPAGHKTPCWGHDIDDLIVKHNSLEY